MIRTILLLLATFSLLASGISASAKSIPKSREITNPQALSVPLVQKIKLRASTPTPDAHFGSGAVLDGNTALIAAGREACLGGPGCGAVYVLVRNANTWTEQAKLVSPDPDQDEYFGVDVALDGNTALIGADEDDCPAGEDCGAAYIFTRSGTTWTFQQKLMAADAEADMWFGHKVALQGSTAVIGAYKDDCTAGIDCGSAYVFTYSGATWTEQTKLTATVPAAESRFTTFISLDGTSLAIGTSEACTAGAYCGAVYVFVGSGASWSLQQRIEASDPGADDAFGWDGDLVGDNLVIGAPGDKCPTLEDNCGSLYMFTRQAGIWTQQARLTAQDSSGGDHFGLSVAYDDETILAGAYRSDCSGTFDCGSAYIFTRNGALWTNQQTLSALDAGYGKNFGFEVDLEGTTAVIGSWTDTCDQPGQDYCGSAYIFDQATPLVASASCNGPDLDVVIAAGDGPFNITSTSGINLPVLGVTVGTTTITGPDKWNDVMVHAQNGTQEVANLGQFKCKPPDRPVPISPAHRAHTTDVTPIFSWTATTGASRYRVFVFDDKVAANRTVDVRQNTGGAETQLELGTPLPLGRLFWRVRGRFNSVWGYWSIRFTLFIDPPTLLQQSSVTPMPSIDLAQSESQSSEMPPDGSIPTVVNPSTSTPSTVVPTQIQPPNSR